MKDLGRMNIYKHVGNTCSNGGLSSYNNEVKIVDGYNRLAPDNWVVIKEDVCCGKYRIRAVPANNGIDNCMFGGSFIYTSNGCVPYSGIAIKLFDRIE